VTIDIAPLLAPISIAGLTLRNRFVMSPMTRQHSPDGVPGANVAAYYTRRAAAGVGLIITEGVGVDHPSAIGSGSMGEHDIPVLHGEAALNGWRNVVTDVHAAGGKIFPQLWHMGGIRTESTPPHPDAKSMRPNEMSEGDIADVIAAFARSAAHARAVGFDGVALHGAHGYLIDGFLWAGTNQRDDAWGGTPVKRAHFVDELVKAVRSAVGASFPIMLRFSQWKLQDYEAKLAETPEQLGDILVPLAEAGVEIFDASTRVFSTPAFAGSNMGLAGWARTLTGKPSMTVGGIGFDKELAKSFAEPTKAINNLDEVLRRFARDEFDLVALGRALLMDADWVEKARTGAPFKPFNLAAYATLD
jgi:2,4-dienoyl-CoA reductase-like NADH-dependent reductase (Old Yellow Enzyme family)